MSVQPLFTPLRMGDLDLPNRIVMAPLTRMRAGSMYHVPTALQAEYYDQRASDGLIVAEATAISADGFAPRPMTIAEIRQTVADYARAARNAMEAGFDGLEILAAYLYLIPQFLNRTTNRRTDEYGGSIENRARILFEVVEAVLEEVDPSRVGVKIGPMQDGGPMAANDETLPITEYAVRKLDGYGL